MPRCAAVGSLSRHSSGYHDLRYLYSYWLSRVIPIMIRDEARTMDELRRLPQYEIKWLRGGSIIIFD